MKKALVMLVALFLSNCNTDKGGGKTLSESEKENVDLEALLCLVPEDREKAIRNLLSEEYHPNQELQPLRLFQSHSRSHYFDVLFNKAYWKPEVQYLATPSFSEEKLLSIKSVGWGYFAQVLKPKEQIANYKGDPAKLEVVTMEKRVPDDIALTAICLWNRMILRAKFQWGPFGLDGTSHYFFGSQLAIVARTWSPDPDTRPGLLVRLGEKLIDYVEGESTEEAVLDEARRLIEQLNRSLSLANECKPPSQRPRQGIPKRGL